MLISGQEKADPEKEALNFEVNLDGSTPEIAQLIKCIKEVAENMLFHWKTFPIVLPPSIAVEGDGSTLGRKPINIRDLFVMPSFDELDAVAADAKGEPRHLTEKQLDAVRQRGSHKNKYGKRKRLNSAQLESVRTCGEFEVESVNFPGQYHRWHLSELLQKGTERAHESMLDDMALALHLIVVIAKGCILSNRFSLWHALCSFGYGLSRLLDSFVGVPSLQTNNVEEKLREERCRYLVAELVCKPQSEEDLDALCHFVHQQIKKASTEKYHLECENLPHVPYLFHTPKGTEVDLRLYNRDLMKKVLPILLEILERESRGWFLQFREHIVSELKAKHLPDEIIEQEANKAVTDNYLRRVFKAILGSADVQALGSGIGQLLIDQAQSVVLMHRAAENVHRKMAKSQMCFQKEVQTIYPVFSRIRRWMQEKLDEANCNFSREYQWSAHEESLALCRAQHLNQTAYFLNRDVTFMREREPVLLQELKKVKNPTRTFHWRTQIWLPSNWVVRRHFQGHLENIQTVLSKNATSITNPRSDPSQPVFLVERECVRTSSTRWPFWRWINYWHRTWSWLWNAMFFFGFIIPWCSPVSLRALLSIEPFMPDLELSQVNGTLFPRKSSTTLTLCSRLLALWRHISKSRTEFETRPDTGFIGKGFTRHVNRTWNYILKGLFGTIVIVLVFPVVCLVTSFGSMAIASTAIFWVPAASFFFHMFMILFYDFDCPSLEVNKYVIVLEATIWKILILGLLQPLTAMFVAVIICPTISLCIFIMAIVCRGLRHLWDTVLFHGVIKKQGHVPASDSFIVKRIAGPGLGSNYFYQIKPEQALAVLEARLEMDELTAYENELERLILKPQYAFSDFCQKCFSPFSAQLTKEGVYKELEKEAQDLITALREKTDKRKRDLQTGLSVGVRSKIKITARELKICLKQGARLLEEFYPTHVFDRLVITKEEFWESKGLLVGDWTGLTAQMYIECFSQDFLTPLEDTDTCFQLDVNHINLSRYIAMVQEAEFRDDPDVSGALHTPKGNIHIHAPYLDVATFNPMSKSGATSRKSETKGSSWQWHPWKWKKSQHHQKSTTLSLTSAYNSTPAEKFLIPLPVPHPTLIAVIVHNRDCADGDDQIPLESQICQTVLKTIEETHCYGTQSVAGAYISLDLDSATVSKNSSVSCDLERESERSHNGQSVQISLASPEDISFEVDTGHTSFSAFGTTV